MPKGQKAAIQPLADATTGGSGFAWINDAIIQRMAAEAEGARMITIPADLWSRAQAHAHTEGQGESVNSFINRAINETIARDKEK